MTNAEADLTQISFHDASLLGIVHTGSVLTLALEGVLIGEVLTAAEVIVDGVSALLRNGSPLSHFQMEKKNGEILTLREENGQILLAIQWDDFIAKTHEIVAYTLNGPNIALHVIHIP